MKIKELALLVKGTIEGNGDIEITGLSGLESTKPGDLTLAIDDERLATAEKSSASCILTSATTRKSSKPLIRVQNPKLSFLVIYKALAKPEEREGFIHPTASVAKSASLGRNVWIGSHVAIEDGVKIGDHTIIESNSSVKRNCEIGPFCCIYPNVTLYEHTRLGENVILHSGVVVGADGFGYVRDKDKVYKFPQLGKVIIEDDVEIGANTTIDRGSLSDTVIGSGSKIDNLCQIAHNVKIGKNALIAAQSGISGSCVIKDNVTMGGQVGIADNITVGNNVMIGAQSGVIKDVPDNMIVWGYPAGPIDKVKREMATIRWFTKNFKSLSKLLKAD